MIKKITFLLLFLVLTLFNGLSQEDSNHEALEVQVRLVTDLETVKLPAYCGTVAWRLTFDFEIINVIEGEYSEKIIPISILCPRESIENEWLITGNEYTFRLKPRIETVELNVDGKAKVVYSGDFEIVYE